jgi:hypothetical protein
MSYTLYNTIFTPSILVSSHLLASLVISITMSLCTLENLSHLCQFLFVQRNISRRKVLFQSVWLGGSRDGDEALSGNPSKSNLCDTTALFVGQLLDFLDNSFVLVKVVA